MKTFNELWTLLVPKIENETSANNGSLSDQSRTNFEALSDQLREIACDLGLSITDINYQFVES